MLIWKKLDLLRPENVVASREDFRVIGTFNPGVTVYADRVQMLLRIAEQPIDRDNGKIGLPRWNARSELEIEWFDPRDIQPLDARVVLHRPSGEARLTSVSHLRLFTAQLNRLDEPGAYREQRVRFLPAAATEAYGVEDPRVTLIGDRFYFTYVAVSRHGACTALASTLDFQSFDRHGIIFPCENKDVLLFPSPVRGGYAALHRPVSATPFGAPEMWVASSADLQNWGNHRPLQFGAEVGTAADWSSGRVGGGVPPLRTEQGWLEIFHGNRRSGSAGNVGEYCAGAMLLALDDPGHVLAVTRRPIMVPSEPFERQGFVPGVVFPTAAIQSGDQLAVYYGAADTSCAVAVCSRAELERTLHSADR